MALQKKTSLWGCHFCPTILLVCLFLHVTFPVKIKRLSVPRWVRNGTDHVILDCEYSYTVSDVRLVVKWFFKDQLEPVYQWIPGLEKRHVSGILLGRLNFNFSVDPSDRYSRYRALYILKPTLEISGKYTCVVTSLASQDLRHKEMLVYAPAKNFSVSHSKVATSETDIFCEATGLYPRPEISLSVVLPDIQKHTVLQGTKKQVNLTNGSYSILLARRFSERDLAKANVLILECKVYIPGTNYKITKEISFYAGLSDVNRGTSRNFSLRCFLLFFAALTLTS
ncbi:uncharacterized protein LOC143233136 isoform X1 [Tachypleus tridentatus]|uniref:uncharacterized protein LOC143233136 isoform X1 n=1 Tax=Tachypleus tridentatus TaxID=6853 RepID=UPI003FD4307A